jgi:hypothetical protein
VSSNSTVTLVSGPAAKTDDLIEQLRFERYENARLRNQLRAFQGWTVIALLASGSLLTSFFLRPAPAHLSACQALQYYLDLTDDDADAIPADTRKILNANAAQCPDDDMDRHDDGNPHR